MGENPPTPPETPFRLFLSYSHKSEAVKDRLKINLAPLQRNGWVSSWDDRAIPAGADWRKTIDSAMQQSDAAVFLLDEYFLASGFCMDVEVATFLQRHRDQGTLILFVLSDHCLWDEFPFISQFQLLPRDAKPIIDFEPPSLAYTAIAREIKASLALHSAKASAVPRIAATLPDNLDELTLTTLLQKLPGATAHLYGRENELAEIDRLLALGHRVLLWVADGGTGKSALLRKWLETSEKEQHWPAGTRFIGHSFYSQGSNNQATSARGFLLDALKQLGVAHEANASDDELGRLLATEAARQPTVLALDGIEPLQQASSDEKLNGTLKDSGLAVLLEALSKRPGRALCLASSRLPVPECGISDGAYFRQRPLNLLPPTGARQLLESRGVTGTADELAALAERCGHHPLALVLAAEFCHTYLQDSAAEFLKRDWQPQPKGHAATVMGWFDAALAEEHQALDRELARILGLFDRPVPWGALMALKDADPIPGLSVALHDASETALLESLARLSQWGLLDADLTREEPDLDAHPLVREHFGDMLKKQDTAAWRAAHSILFEWFRGVYWRQPDTLEEFEPLCRAVAHGCNCGRYRTALENVYQYRILGEDRYLQFQLGGWSSCLIALSGFFPNGWENPPEHPNAETPEELLCQHHQHWLIAELAFCLASLGRVTDALRLRRLELDALYGSNNWTILCRSTVNSAGLLNLTGQWVDAEKICRVGIDAASLIQDEKLQWQHLVAANVCLGHTLHGLGRLEEAKYSYRNAELVQAHACPNDPMLNGIGCYYRSQLHFEQNCHPSNLNSLLKQVEYGLKVDSRNNHLLSMALHHCNMALIYNALNKSDTLNHYADAIRIMQLAGKIERQPSTHLARAQYLRSQHDFPAAWEDHEAAHSIARRGNMRTYLAECALLAGNLHLDQGDAPNAAAQYAEAAQLIREDGYGRREAELRLLDTRLRHAQHDPAAPDALAGAEARIRETGQWFFWRELRAVAQEIGADDPGECPQAG